MPVEQNEQDARRYKEITMQALNDYARAQQQQQSFPTNNNNNNNRNIATDNIKSGSGNDKSILCFPSTATTSGSTATSGSIPNTTTSGLSFLHNRGIGSAATGSIANTTTTTSGFNFLNNCTTINMSSTKNASKKNTTDRNDTSKNSYKGSNTIHHNTDMRTSIDKNNSNSTKENPRDSSAKTPTKTIRALPYTNATTMQAFNDYVRTQQQQQSLPTNNDNNNRNMTTDNVKSGSSGNDKSILCFPSTATTATSGSIPNTTTSGLSFLNNGANGSTANTSGLNNFTAINLSSTRNPSKKNTTDRNDTSKKSYKGSNTIQHNTDDNACAPSIDMNNSNSTKGNPCGNSAKKPTKTIHTLPSRNATTGTIATAGGKGSSITKSVHKVDSAPKKTSTSSSSKKNKTKSKSAGTKNTKFCDLCWGSDGRRGMILQTCVVCNVSIHNECYGIEGESIMEKNPDFKCWACLAVGTTVKVRDGTKYTITDRPTHCILCSVNDKHWMHAMHPVYDNCGLRGRQLVVSDNSINSNNNASSSSSSTEMKTLAWAHTLCAFTINTNVSTSGCVYGCTQDGQYPGYEEYHNNNKKGSNDDDDNDDDDDEGSINSVLFVQPDDPTDVSIHHFVYVLPDPKNPNKNEQWTKSIQAHQNDLKCYLCGKRDNNDKQQQQRRSYRIPLQCCANDGRNEFAEFHGKFPELTKRNEQCYVAAHVGCALWYTNDDGQYPPYRRVFYYPGSTNVNDQYPETVANIFCTRHAKDLQEANVGGTKVQALKYPSNKIALPVEYCQPTRDSNGNIIHQQTNGTTIPNNRPVLPVKSDEEKKREKKERFIRMIQQDLVKHSKHFDKKDIVNLSEDYKKRLRTRLSCWKKELNNHTLTHTYFDIALQRCLENTLKIRMEDYPTTDDLVVRTMAATTTTDQQQQLHNNHQNQHQQQQLMTTTTISSSASPALPHNRKTTGVGGTNKNQLKIQPLQGKKKKDIITTKKRPLILINGPIQQQQRGQENVESGTSSSSSNVNKRIVSGKGTAEQQVVGTTCIDPSNNQMDFANNNNNNDFYNESNDDNNMMDMVWNNSDHHNNNNNDDDNNSRLEFLPESICQEIVTDLISKSIHVNRRTAIVLNDNGGSSIHHHLPTNQQQQQQVVGDMSNPYQSFLNESKLYWRNRLQATTTTTTTMSPSSSSFNEETFNLVWENDIVREFYSWLEENNVYYQKPIDWSFLIGPQCFVAKVDDNNTDNPMSSSPTPLAASNNNKENNNNITSSSSSNNNMVRTFFNNDWDTYEVIHSIMHDTNDSHDVNGTFV